MTDKNIKMKKEFYGTDECEREDCPDRNVLINDEPCKAVCPFGEEFPKCPYGRDCDK